MRTTSPCIHSQWLPSQIGTLLQQLLQLPKPLLQCLLLSSLRIQLLPQQRQLLLLLGDLPFEAGKLLLCLLVYGSEALCQLLSNICCWEVHHSLPATCLQPQTQPSCTSELASQHTAGMARQHDDGLNLQTRCLAKELVSKHAVSQLHELQTDSVHHSAHLSHLQT
jgi:hypothetical protein